MTALSHPKLMANLAETGDSANRSLLLDLGGRQFAVELDLPEQQLTGILLALDGSATVAEVSVAIGAEVEVVEAICQALSDLELLVNIPMGDAVTGREAVCAIEDRLTELMLDTVFFNEYWDRILGSEGVPDLVLYGTALENYHFLRHESWFDSPALVHVGNAEVQKLVNGFYVDEFGHDELLRDALCSLGPTPLDLATSTPLPATMALCNSLAWWARTDPILFLSTLGVLEGRENETDSFLKRCEQQRLPEAFVAPLRKHAAINQAGQHGNLTRSIFFKMPAIAGRELERLLGRLTLFTQLYDAFYSAIWAHYSTADRLLRPSRVYWDSL